MVCVANHCSYEAQGGSCACCRSTSSSSSQRCRQHVSRCSRGRQQQMLGAQWHSRKGRWNPASSHVWECTGSAGRARKGTLGTCRRAVRSQCRLSAMPLVPTCPLPPPPPSLCLQHYRLARMFPDGPHDMTWSFDISSTPLPPGHVSGEFAVLTAVAQSVVRCKAANALDMADAMAASYDPSAPTHWYSPYSQLMLEGLAAGEC